MELENFQDIIDFPNYMINENGEIYSKFKKRLLKPGLITSGYTGIMLRRDKKNIYKTIHRLLGLQYLRSKLN